MKKEEVYKLIGYQGEYTTNVKRMLRKLLKENHPDNNGNRKDFEIINEVKKELESGKTHFFKKNINSENNKEINYDYYYQMINTTKIKRDNLNKLLNEKKYLLNEYEQKYKELYQLSLDLENNLLSNSPYFKKTKNIKYLSIILVIVMIIIFIWSMVKNDTVLFIIFIITAIICVLSIQEYLVIVHKMTDNNKKRLSHYFKLNSEIRNTVNKQANLKKDIREIKRKISNMDNDIRFYKNMMK